MKKIRLVEQEDKMGCGVACIAMVLGKRYEDVAADFLNDFNQSGMATKTLIDYLGNHGFSILYKEVSYWSMVNFAKKEMLRPFAPVHVVAVKPRFDSINEHFVVMDAKGKLICPGGNTDKDIRNSYAVTETIGLFNDK